LRSFPVVQGDQQCCHEQQTGEQSQQHLKLAGNRPLSDDRKAAGDGFRCGSRRQCGSPGFAEEFAE